MTIQDRIKETEQKFEQQKALLQEQDTIIKNAEAASVEIRTEMAKLQGEFRLLKNLDEPNKKAGVIEAVPEEKK